MNKGILPLVLCALVSIGGAALVSRYVVRTLQGEADMAGLENNMEYLAHSEQALPIRALLLEAIRRANEEERVGSLMQGIEKDVLNPVVLQSHASVWGDTAKPNVQLFLDYASPESGEASRLALSSSGHEVVIHHIPRSLQSIRLALTFEALTQIDRQKAMAFHVWAYQGIAKEDGQIERWLALNEVDGEMVRKLIDKFGRERVTEDVEAAKRLAITEPMCVIDGVRLPISFVRRAKAASALFGKIRAGKEQPEALRRLFHE